MIPVMILLIENLTESTLRPIKSVGTRSDLVETIWVNELYFSGFCFQKIRSAMVPGFGFCFHILPIRVQGYDLSSKN